MLAKPKLADIEAAAERLDGLAVKTPLIEHPALNERVGGRVLLKAESLQRIGAFKFRGAFNAVSQIDAAKHPGGVVAASSGNHAQGIAAAAKICGVPAAIVMPADAPAAKLRRTAELGAEVVTYDRATEDRTAIALALASDRQADFVHPFDDPRVIAGQGTVGLELMAEVARRNAAVDEILVCCAGGGLLSGISIAARAASSTVVVRPVEPVGFDDFARSLQAGERLANTRKSGSICDALLVDRPGDLTFAIAQENCASGAVVSDDDAKAAMRFAFDELRLVLEPGGAVALAAVLTGKVDAKGRVIACILSGGNVDAKLFADVIT